MNVELWLGIGSAMASFLVGWGMLRGKVVELERRLQIAEREVLKLHDTYVSYKHFDAVMVPIREDLRKILDLLSAR